MTGEERAVFVQEFMRHHLTSSERLVVAAMALGFRQQEIARHSGISPAAVSKMVRRIREKADAFWM